MGVPGEAWLPGLLADLATDWSITVGARLDGSTASYVADATTHDGTPVVLKVPTQPGIDEFTPFELAGGGPYVGLIRHGVPRQALLLARLGRPMAALGWSASRQMEALVRTAARGRRPVAGRSRLPTGPEAARWHAGFIPATWADLGQPFPEALADLAVRGAAALIWEPAHGWLEELAASDPQQALEKVIASCLRLGDCGEAEALAPLLVTGERWPTRQRHQPSPDPGGGRPGPAKLLLMVGLPGAGKTTRAKELAAAHRALRLTPDEWMISLFDGSQPDGKRDLLEGRLIALALQALQLGTNVVLDFGLWSRGERSALRWLAASAGASCEVIYLPIDKDLQHARIAHRQETTPHTTFPMADADIEEWRKQFQAPDAAELRGGRTIPDPPPGWSGWLEWATDRWPSLASSSDAPDAPMRIPASGQMDGPAAHATDQ